MPARDALIRCFGYYIRLCFFFFWVHVGTAWFIALSIVSFRWKVKIPCIPSLLIVCILAPPVLFSYVVMFGDQTLLPFLVIAIISWIISLRRAWQPRSLRIEIHAIAACALMSIFISTIPEIMHPTPRGPVDIVLRWEGTSQERMAFHRLKQMEPRSVDAYREIVRKASLYAVSAAAARLAKIGDPKVDVPIIIDALERQQKNAYPYIDDKLQESLSKMTGLPVRMDRSVEEWKKLTRPAN